MSDSNSFDFNNIQKKNEEKRQKMEKDRLKSNKGVLRSYDIKGGKSTPSQTTKSSHNTRQESEAPKKAAPVLSLAELKNKKQEVSVPKESKLPSNWLDGITVDHAGRIFVTALDNNGQSLGIRYSKDLGKSWERIALPSIHSLVTFQKESDGLSYCLLAQKNDPNAYVIARSGDYLHWQYLNAPNERYLSHPTMAVSVDHEIYVCSTRRLLVSRDLGKTYQVLADNLSNRYNGFRNIVKLGHAKHNEKQYLYLLSSDGLHLSKDCGNTWLLTNLKASAEYTGLFVDEQSRIYVTVSGAGLLMSVDHGNSWREVNTSRGIASGYVQDIKNKGSDVYLAHRSTGISAGGVSVSRDGGDTWAVLSRANGMLPDDNINRLCFDDNGNLYVTTLSSGLVVLNKELMVTAIFRK